jgi:hypothetical protein
MLCRTASLRRGRREAFGGSWLLLGEPQRRLQICESVRVEFLGGGALELTRGKTGSHSGTCTSRAW